MLYPQPGLQFRCFHLIAHDPPAICVQYLVYMYTARGMNIIFIFIANALTSLYLNTSPSNQIRSTLVHFHSRFRSTFIQLFARVGWFVVFVRFQCLRKHFLIYHQQQQRLTLCTANIGRNVHGGRSRAFTTSFIQPFFVISRAQCSRYWIVELNVGF